MEKLTPEHEKYEKELEEELKKNPKASFAPCKNCKTEIRRNMRRCPYCGILNPTVTIKEIVFTTIVMIVFLYAFAMFFN